MGAGFLAHFALLFFIMSLISFFLVTSIVNQFCAKVSLNRYRFFPTIIFILCYDYLLLNSFFSLVNRLLLIQSGSVEPHPGPSYSKLSFATWNVDSLLAREGAKKPLIESIQNVHQFDIFGICETYLTNKIPENDLILDGFSAAPLRADCKIVGGKSQGGVCLYYKDHLPFKRRSDLEVLDESIVIEINLNRKKIILLLVYRPPSQTSVEFSVFMKKLSTFYEKAVSTKPSCIILTGDFNARSPFFWGEESRQTPEGKKLSEFCLSNGLEQIINEPTHFPRDGIETCIDLIITDQPLIYVDSGVIPSPDPCCKHQIIHGKLNFSVPCPPPYKRRLWKFNLANIHLIKESLANIDWHKQFLNKSPDEMVSTFSDSFLTIMSFFIPNKVVTIDDRDAPWVTPEVKKMLCKNKKAFSTWIKKGRNPTTRYNIKQIQLDTNRMINNAKTKYIKDLSNKICDPTTGSKAFHTAFKRLSNKKKITSIPPLLENGHFISNFTSKADIFNTYFAAQCRPLENDCLLPSLSYTTNKSISDVSVTEGTISSIINKMNSKKAHGCDNISIAMLQLCSVEVSKPLLLIYQKSLLNGTFPSAWKYANVQPVHKKNCKQDKNNYRPISLLPVCGKICE